MARKKTGPNQTEALRLFQKLQASSVFQPGHETAKLAVLESLFAHKEEISAFAGSPERSDDVAKRDREIIGFLVELCACFSKVLPQNTPKAEKVREKLIRHLQDAGLANPDCIWVTFTGRRATIVGIGEVKSSIRAMEGKPFQMFWQERNIAELEQRPKIVVADKFFRYVILPRGAWGNVRHFAIPYGWEWKEIEFSYEEILFLGKELVSGFKKELAFRTTHEESMRRFAADLMDKIEKRVGAIFSLPSSSDMVRAIARWVLFYNRLPHTQAAITRICRHMHKEREVYERAEAALARYRTTPTPYENLPEPQQKIFTLLFGEDGYPAQYVLSFLENTRLVREALPRQRRTKADAEMTNANIFELL